jgi:hypothetical protein
MAVRPVSGNSLPFYSKQVDFNYVNIPIQDFFTKIVQTIAAYTILLTLRINAL